MPFIQFIYDNNSNRLKFINGLDYKLITIIQSILKFSYKIVDCENIWDMRLVDKNWTGIIGLFHSKVIY